MRPVRLAVVIGTRPEAVKLAPLVLVAREDPERFEVQLLSTGQHKEMLRSMLGWFGLTPDTELDIMRPDQSISHITTAALTGLEAAFAASRPDWVVVQGDTTTTFAGALAAFYEKIPVAHVEAGLRTHDRYSPFPEEMNRVLTGQLATLHLAPTERPREHLLREGIADEDIEITGNTGIDGLLWTIGRLSAEGEMPPSAEPHLLLTMHRRENRGEPMARVCRAVLELLERHPALTVRFPMHMSPQVRSVVMPLLGGHDRVELCEPLGYVDFVRAMSQATLILSDSGGVQEEAPSLGKPVLVLRESTERPEAIEAGVARLVGTDEQLIVAEADTILSGGASGLDTSGRNPYGDGQASARVLEAIARRTDLG
ncbi:non-hydrolyzing UDP-N-acetylglucosamine 2-epimerase [Actinomycetota bacterium]